MHGLRVWTLHRTSGVRLVCLAVAMICISQSASASILGAPEEDSWSDMAFPTGVVGGFNSVTKLLNLTASPSNDLEIGGEFGPSNLGKHYGAGGTLGGMFSAKLKVNGVEIQPNGSVTNGGSVLITFNGGAAGSIGTDYGIAIGEPLLIGTVLDVLLDARGDNSLDVLFYITGGALQNDNPILGTKFAPSDKGLLRFAGVPMPSDFSGSFSLSGATLNVFGIPEPVYTTLAFFVGIFAWGFGAPRRESRLETL